MRAPAPLKQLNHPLSRADKKPTAPASHQTCSDRENSPGVAHGAHAPAGSPTAQSTLTAVAPSNSTASGQSHDGDTVRMACVRVCLLVFILVITHNVSRRSRAVVCAASVCRSAPTLKPSASHPSPPRRPRSQTREPAACQTGPGPPSLAAARAPWRTATRRLPSRPRLWQPRMRVTRHVKTVCRRLWFLEMVQQDSITRKSSQTLSVTRCMVQCSRAMCASASRWASARARSG